MHDMKDFLARLRGVNEWGPILARAVKADGRLQREIADIAAIDPSVLSKMMKGTVYIEAGPFDRLCDTLRTTLVPATLAAALGYRVRVPGSDRLPRGLVQDLLELDEQGWAAVAIAVQGQLALRRIAEAKNA